MNMIADLLNRYHPWVKKILDPVVITLWRLGLGRLFNLWPAVIGRIMVIKHYDLKNGTSIYTAVNFIERDSGIYCVAHREVNSEWIQNIMANPQVEVWLPDGWYAGQADAVEYSEDRLELLRSVFSGNPIPAKIAGIDPELEDAVFEMASENYQLVRVIRQSPRTGVDGPGGLAWMWPFILMLLLRLRPRKRR